MTPEQLQRRADRTVATARAFLADPNDMELRRAFMMTTFNHDLTAAAIVALADRAIAKAAQP